jgi:3-phenylpropionate/trans-cinnamate dioxygenase ferredoxin reductase subunit
VVIIGGGFIGLEVAAAARRRARQVTVLEAADRLMARVVAPLIVAVLLRPARRPTASRWCSVPWFRNWSASDGRIAAVKNR